MHKHHLADMVRRLGPVLKDKARAYQILTKYWRNKMALVWEVKDVHRAANELELALTNQDAIDVLQTLLELHNAQYGIKWADITNHIHDKALGRKLTKREVKQFVQHDKLTIRR